MTDSQCTWLIIPITSSHNLHQKGNLTNSTEDAIYKFLIHDKHGITSYRMDTFNELYLMSSVFRSKSDFIPRAE